MYYVYVLKGIRDFLYVGYSEDLRRRFAEHENGQTQSTRGHRPLTLVYYEAYASKSDAMRRERMLKHHKKGFAMLRRRIVNSLEA